MYCKKTIFWTTITQNTRTQVICLLNSLSFLLLIILNEHLLGRQGVHKGLNHSAGGKAEYQPEGN